MQGCSFGGQHRMLPLSSGKTLFAKRVSVLLPERSQSAIAVSCAFGGTCKQVLSPDVGDSNSHFRVYRYLNKLSVLNSV